MATKGRDIIATEMRTVLVFAAMLLSMRSASAAAVEYPTDRNDCMSMDAVGGSSMPA
jgi:hypothetical protein